MVSQIPPIVRILQDAGTTKTIIDGAVGRKSLAVPEVAQAVVLATGAGLSRSIETVIAETAHIAAIFNLPNATVTPVGAALCRPMPGAITDAKIDGFYDHHIIADDPTKILITPRALSKLKLSGGRISVKNPINLAAITINPTSPYGTNFDPNDFLIKMQQAISTPIFNIANTP